MKQLGYQLKAYDSTIFNCDRALVRLNLLVVERTEQR